MTPEEERKQFREIFFLKELADRLEKEGWERDKRLLRAEQRIVSLSNGLSLLGGAVLFAAFGYAIFQHTNSFWDWVGIAVGGVCVFLMIREAIQRFYKD